MGELEGRVKRLETKLGIVETKVGNLRWWVLTTGVLVAFALFSAGQADRQFVLERMTAGDDRAASQFDAVASRLYALNDSIRSQADAVASRFDAVASSFDAVNSRLDAMRDADAIREASQTAREDARAAEVREELRSSSARLAGAEWKLNGLGADVRVLSSELGGTLSRIEDKLDRRTTAD